MEASGDLAHSLALAAPTINVPYETLHSATGGFSSALYAQGGHKLGEGGSGEVFHCKIPLMGGWGAQEIAVKVLWRSEDQKAVSAHCTSCTSVTQELLYHVQGDSGMRSLDQKQFMAEIQALSMSV